MGDVQDGSSGNPIVELVDSSTTGDARTTTVRALGDELDPPIAPASLIDLETRASVCDLHQLVRRHGSTFTFETYGPSEAPSAGRYALQSWWLPEAFHLVTDATRVWTEARYGTGELPDTGPDFCYLTFETLNVGDRAFTDGRGSWISLSGYDLYIARDVLRLRRQPPPVG
jgi:hypothetical protein